MSTYTPKRHERGQWIVGIVGPWSEWKLTIWREWYCLRAWWRRNAWSALLVVVALALTTATIVQIGAIYEPKQQVPFLPAISAVRG